MLHHLEYVRTQAVFLISRLKLNRYSTHTQQNRSLECKHGPCRDSGVCKAEKLREKDWWLNDSTSVLRQNVRGICGSSQKCTYIQKYIDKKMKPDEKMVIVTDFPCVAELIHKRYILLSLLTVVCSPHFPPMFTIERRLTAFQWLNEVLHQQAGFFHADLTQQQRVALVEGFQEDFDVVKQTGPNKPPA